MESECAYSILLGRACQSLFVGRIGQHGLHPREAAFRKVGARSVRRAVPGYSLDVHAVDATEERKCLPLWLPYP